MKIYLDDTRPCPEGWVLVRTVEQAIKLLETEQVEEISLDNDLGLGYTEGWEVLDFLEETVFDNKNFPMPIVSVHSANPVRVAYMKRVLGSIERIRQQQVGGA